MKIWEGEGGTKTFKYFELNLFICVMYIKDEDYEGQARLGEVKEELSPVADHLGKSRAKAKRI